MLHQRKCDELERISKNIANDIFSHKIKLRKKDGSNYDNWELKSINEITIWDKKFSGIEQKQTASFKHVSAEFLKEIRNNNGQIKLLSTGNFDGFTEEFIATEYINDGEIIAIPSGGSPSIKYYKGKFIDSGNILGMSSNEDLYLTQYLYFYLKNNINILELNFRGASIKHPDMPMILSEKIEIPCIEEQKQIVFVLSNFENLINNEKKVIDELKKVKKTLLDKMFA